MSPMGTAASTCQCVPECATSSSRAQHSHEAFSGWLVELSWAQEPPALQQGSLPPPQKLCWLPHPCQLQPELCSSEINLKEQQPTEGTRLTNTKAVLGWNGLTLSWNREGETAGGSFKLSQPGEVGAGAFDASTHIPAWANWCPCLALPHPLCEPAHA